MTASRWSPAKTGVLVVFRPFLYPFVFLVATAIKPLSAFNQNEVNLPSSPTLHNLADAWHTAALGPAMLHSVIAVAVAVVVTVAISVAGAFWFLDQTGASHGRPASA